MTTLLENDLPVSHIMEAVKEPLLIRRGEGVTPIEVMK